MPSIPINEKPDYNTDQIANAISSNDMWDCITEVVPGVGNVTRRRPALKSFADLGTGVQGDGLFWWDDKGVPIAVSGGRIFTLNIDGIFTEITGATLAAGAPVTFAAGTDHAQTTWLYMANGKLAYSVNGAITVAPTDPDTPAASHVDWIDQKFIANSPGTNQFLFTDVNDDVGKKVFSIKINAGSNPIITTTTLRPGVAGKAWGDLVNVSGGTPPYTWTAPNLPSGFTISTGGISGATGLPAATTTPAAGIYSLPLTVTDSLSKTASVTLSLTVTAAITSMAIDQSEITGTINVYQRNLFTATGGFDVLNWSATGLPFGMTLSSQFGVLTGTPTAAGTYKFTITASNNYSTATQTVTYIVADQVVAPGTYLAISTASLPDATVGVAYSASLAATGAVGALNWSAAGFPPGLAMDINGNITGTPVTADSFSAIGTVIGAEQVTISVTDGSVSGYFDNAFWSGANNPVIANAKGQKVDALMVAWQQVYAWGSLGCQIFQDDGVTPFVNIPGAFIEAGLEAPYSVKRGNNAIFALCVIDGKRVVVLLIGSTPRVVSEPIARVLAEMSTVSDAIGDLISVGGLAIYLLQFPTAAQTWAYDYHHDEWFRWGSWDATTQDHGNFLGQHSCFCKAWNKHLIMSRVDGKIYELDRNTFTDAATSMVSYRRTGWIDQGMVFNRKRSNQFYIKVKVFAQDGTTNPVLLFRWRDDGNPNWSSYLELPLNPNFQGDCLIKLNRMGMYRMRQYEFRISDNVDLALVAATEDVTEMRN